MTPEGRIHAVNTLPGGGSQPTDAVEGATERARAQGVKQLYLVTDGAQGYFGEKLGFQPVDRRDVDPGIATTAEYLLARSRSATWMRKDL